MKRNLNYRITAMLIIALAIMFIGVSLAGQYELYKMAVYAALGSAFMTFLIFLDVKQDRVIKGFTLIGIGVVYQLVYPRFFYVFVDVQSIPSELAEHFSIFGQVILLACSGAGGSIIAAHADKTSSDYEDRKSAFNIVDNTKHIQKLIQRTSMLESKLNRTITLLTFSLILSSVTILTVALR